jgi:hypothetical protein
MTRTLRSTLLPALLLLVAGTARADQLAWIPKADAEKAQKVLAPGTLFVDWISHMPGKPAVYEVVSSEVADTGSPGYFELKVKAIRVAEGRTVRQPTDRAFAFVTVPRGEAQVLSVDLAYIYVPSSEVAYSFVNLGKKLRLECSIKAVAIEVGEDTIARITAARPRGSIVGGLTER